MQAEQNNLNNLKTHFFVFFISFYFIMLMHCLIGGDAETTARYTLHHPPSVIHIFSKKITDMKANRLQFQKSKLL